MKFSPYRLGFTLIEIISVLVILGILAGYAVAAVFTLIGNATATDALKVLDFSKLSVLWENGVTLKTTMSL